MSSEFRYALRVFRRQPVIYATATAGLALAIAVSTAVFTILNVSVLKGSGVRAADQVVTLSLNEALFPTDSYSGMVGAWAHRDAVQLRAALPHGDIVAVRQSASERVADATAAPDTAPAVAVDQVSGNYFSTLGGRPRLGRLLTLEDDRPEAPAVAVLSETFWKRAFDGRADIVGRTIRVSDIPFQVVGVVSSDFTGPNVMRDTAAGVWIPIEASRAIFEHTVVRQAAEDRRRLAELRARASLSEPDRESLETLQARTARTPPPWNPAVHLLARPRQGIAAAKLIQAVSDVAIELAAARGQTLTGPAVAVRASTVAARESGQFSSFLLGLTIGAVLVVVLACANVANALLAAGAARGRELAVRRAMGAGRWRVIRQTLVEASLIGVGGGAIGYLLASWIAPVLGALHTTDPLIAFTPDRNVFTFAAASCLAVSLLAGLAPLRQASRVDVLRALRGASLATASVRGGLRSVLIGLQASVSIIVLLSAALLGRSLHHAATLDVGVNPARFMEVSIGLNGYDDRRADAYWNRALDRVRQVAGVEAVSLVHESPFDGGYQPVRWMDGQAGQSVNVVSTDYFETLQLRILRGRTFTMEEVRSNAPVAVVTERVARTFWPDGNPVGDTLDRVLSLKDEDRFARPQQPGLRIVGVVTDSVTDLWRSDWRTIYRPTHGSRQNYQLLIRAADPAAVAGGAIAALRTIDPEQSPSVTLMGQNWRRQLDYPKRLAVLAAVVALAAMSLAAIGLIGVTAFVVRLRRHELSVRNALGATRGSLITLICRDSLKPVLAGVVFGLIPAFWSTRVIEQQVLGISLYDPAAITLAVLLLVGSAALAAFVPARRAAHANPADLLRES